MPVDWCDIFSFIKTDSSIPVLKTLAGKVILQTRAGVQTALGGGGGGLGGGGGGGGGVT